MLREQVERLLIQALNTKVVLLLIIFLVVIYPIGNSLYYQLRDVGIIPRPISENNHQLLQEVVRSNNKIVEMLDQHEVVSIELRRSMINRIAQQNYILELICENTAGSAIVKADCKKMRLDNLQRGVVEEKP